MERSTGRTRSRRVAAALVAVVALAAAAALLVARGCDDGGPGGETAEHAAESGAPAPREGTRPEEPRRPRARRPEDVRREGGRGPGERPSPEQLKVRVVGVDGTSQRDCHVRLGTLGQPASRSFVTGPDGVADFDDAPATPLLVQWGPSTPLLGMRGGARVVRDVRDIDVTLEPLLPLCGRVVGPGGEPVVSTQLAVMAVESSPLRLRVLETTATSLAPGGTFSFLVPPGRWWIEVRPQFRRDDPKAGRCGPFDAGTEDVRIVLDGSAPDAGLHGPRIRGTARWPDGLPAVGWVWFLRDPDPGERFERTPYAAVARDGTFRSPALLAGWSYDVVLRDDGGGRIGHGWALASGVHVGSEVALVAHPGRALVGRVLDSEGRAIGGVPVHATHKAGWTIDPFDARATTDLEGRFTVRDAAPFPVRLVAGGEGTRWFTADPPLVSEGAAEGIVVRVLPTVAVAGRVRFEDGAPVGGGVVTWGRNRSATVKPDGSFRLEGFVPGRAQLEWTPDSSSSYVPFPLDPVVAPCEDAALVLRLPK